MGGNDARRSVNGDLPCACPAWSQCRDVAANRPENVDALLARMDALLAPLEERKDPIRFFLATYRRTERDIGRNGDREREPPAPSTVALPSGLTILEAMVKSPDVPGWNPPTVAVMV